MQKILLFLLCFSLYNCNNSNKESFNVFRPEKDVTYKGLLNNGFSILPEDVLILGKQIEDTLLYYIFDWNAGNNSRPSHRYCIFPVNNLEEDFIKDYLEIHRGLFIINSSLLFDIHGFYVRDGRNNFIFHCRIDKEDSTMTLDYGYPQYNNLKVKQKDSFQYEEQQFIIE